MLGLVGQGEGEAKKRRGPFRLPRLGRLRPAPIMVVALVFVAGQLTVVASDAQALEAIGGHSADTPYMGWDSYYAGLGSIGCARPSWTGRACLNESNIERIADVMARDGLRDAGYRYVWIDTGWWDGHRVDGRIDLTDGNRANQWPDGMKAVADYVHADGLRLGIYTDAGRETCGDGVGSYQTPTPAHPNPYEQDVDQFAAWGIDAVKVDFCGGMDDYLDPAVVYGQFRDAILKRDSAMLLAIDNFFRVGWVYSTLPNAPADLQHSAQWSYTFGPATGDSWRTDTDIANAGPKWGPSIFYWSNVLRSLDSDALHPESAGPGQWNDPDALDPDPEQGLTEVQAQAQFAMWAILAAPLVIGSDVRPADSNGDANDHNFDYGPGTSSSAALQTLTNNSVLQDVVRDPLGAQGTQVASSPGGNQQAWMRRLSGAGNRALALLNRNTDAQGPAPTSVRWSSLGLVGTPSVTVLSWPNSIITDPASKVTLLSGPQGLTAYNVPAGGAVLLSVKGTERVDWTPVLGSPPSSDPPAGAPVFVSVPQPGGLAQELAFARGRRGDLLMARLANGVPSGWLSLGGRFSGAPAPVASTTGAVDVFVRGVDGAVWRLSSGEKHRPSRWEWVANLGVDSPAAVKQPDGRIDLFARGADGALWHIDWERERKHWRGSSPVRYPGPAYGTAPDPANQHFLGVPAATSTRAGTIDVVVRGVDDALYWLHYTTAAGPAGGWYQLPGQATISASPAVATDEAGALDVFARAAGDTLWTTRRIGGRWSSWSQLGGPTGGALASAPSAGSGVGVVDLGGLGFDGRPYEVRQHLSAGSAACSLGVAIRHRRRSHAGAAVLREGLPPSAVAPKCLRAERVALSDLSWRLPEHVKGRVECPRSAAGGCDFAFVLVAGRGTPKARRSAHVLGLRSTLLAPGGRQTVGLALGRSGRRLLADRGVRVELALVERIAGRAIRVATAEHGS